MHRPSMDPGLPTEPAPVPARKPLFQHLLTAAVAVYRFLTADVLPHARRHRRGRPYPEPRAPFLTRLLTWFMIRAALVPVVALGYASVLVYAATHPGTAGRDVDPGVVGLYYEPLNLVADDGVRSESWLVPVLDAKRVVELGNAALTAKYPAIILVHDFASGRQQMLPLVRPLHDAGMIVLVLGLRGEGDAAAPAGQTFGLTESRDVLAAVHALQRRRDIDANRVAVLGTGAGATAALIAARADTTLSAVALLDPPTSSADAALASHVAPPQPGLAFLTPLCAQLLEHAYSVDTSDLALSTFRPLLAQRPVLLLDHRAGPTKVPTQSLEQIRQFLTQHLTLASTN